MTMQESYRPNQGERGAESIRAGSGPLLGASGRSAGLRFGIGLPLTVAVGLLVWWLADWSQMLDALPVLAGRPELLGLWWSVIRARSCSGP